MSKVRAVERVREISEELILIKIQTDALNKRRSELCDELIGTNLVTTIKVPTGQIQIKVKRTRIPLEPYASRISNLKIRIADLGKEVKELESEAVRNDAVDETEVRYVSVVCGGV